MRSLRKASLVWLFATLLAVPAVAQNAPSPGTSTASAPRIFTGKERLGRKWMDEQRIDNCNVPIEKRGTRPRPSVCPHLPTS